MSVDDDIAVELKTAAADTDRQYKPVRGRKRGLLMFVPHDRHDHRYLPFNHILAMEVNEEGTLVRIDWPDCSVRLEGQRLRPVAEAVAGAMGGRIESFNPKKHDQPPPPKAGREPDPFITRIVYLMPPTPQSKKEDA